MAIWVVTITNASAISAVPEMPQNVKAFKSTVLPEADCVVIVQWNPPNNAAETSVQHYIVEHPSGKIETANITVKIPLLIQHCETETFISIFAVDRCGRNGSRTNNILAELLGPTSGPKSMPATDEPNFGEL